MRRLRKIVNAILVLCLIIVSTPLCVHASSAGVMDSEIAEMNINNIDYDLLFTDATIFEAKYTNIISINTEHIRSDIVERCASAIKTDQYGNSEELLCELELYTIEIDPNYLETNDDLVDRSTSNVYVIYVLRGTTKDTSSNCSGHGVSLSGTITWIDNTGVNNEFVSASGSRSGNYTGSGRAWVRKNSDTLVGWTYFSTDFTANANPNLNNIGLQFTLHIDSDTLDGHNVQLSFSNSIFS